MIVVAFGDDEAILDDEWISTNKDLSSFLNTYDEIEPILGYTPTLQHDIAQRDAYLLKGTIISEDPLRTEYPSNVVF